MGFFVRNGLQMPLAARYHDHVGELAFIAGFEHFFTQSEKLFS